MGMSETMFGLKQCPECGSDKLVPVAAGAKTNFFCEDCVLCWHLERGRVTVVDPQTCPGCELGTTACFERWDISSRPRGGSSVTARQGVISPGESGREGGEGWGDIESELYSSAREASVECFPLGESESERAVEATDPGPAYAVTSAARWSIR